VSSSTQHQKELTVERTQQIGDKTSVIFHPSHIDEAVLWKAFKGGDEKALIVMFDRFAKALYNYGVKIHHEGEVVKDAVQELFIELWKNKENLADTDSIKFYLFKSLRRKLFRIKKSKADHDFLQLSELDDSVAPSHEFFVIAEQTSLEKRQRLMKMLDSLTARQREAVLLRYFEEMSYDKIAGIMEMSKQSAYNLIHKAISQLRGLEEDEPCQKI
jgi:RNA polymerase sigma factor (sigma-70 family)